MHAHHRRPSGIGGRSTQLLSGISRSCHFQLRIVILISQLYLTVFSFSGILHRPTHLKCRHSSFFTYGEAISCNHETEFARHRPGAGWQHLSWLSTAHCCDEAEKRCRFHNDWPRRPAPEETRVVGTHGDGGGWVDVGESDRVRVLIDARERHNDCGCATGNTR